jgi:hypothetical protein
MGIFNKIRGGAGAGKGYNSYQVPPKPTETHTVRDDSQNTTQAMTQRRADRDAAQPLRPSILQSNYVKPDGSPVGNPRERVKIGAEYTTYHEPSSPEGSAILKDKKKTAKALKNVNSPKVMAESKAGAESFDRAKESQRQRKIKDSAPWSKGESKPSGSEAAYIQGGSKMEKRYNETKK